MNNCSNVRLKVFMNKETKILIVEDSPTQAIGVQYFLEQCGYNVSVVHTGKEAISILSVQRPSVIISDIVMPEMDGYEMCRIIKDNNELKDIPIILLTGLSEPADILQGLSVGASDYIIKPFDNKALLEKIEFVLISSVKEPDNEKSGQEDLIVNFGGKRYVIKANRTRILHLLISTYENVICQNIKLTGVRLELEKINKELGSKLSELEASQTNLRASEERFRILVQMIPDIVYRIDRDGKFTFINNAVQFLGYFPSELIGKHYSVIMSPEDARKVSSAEILKGYAGKNTGISEQPKLFDERRTGERITRGLEIDLIPKEMTVDSTSGMWRVTGKIIIVEINSSGLYESKHKTKESELVGTVGVIRDITQRKIAENAVTKLNEELEQKIRERTGELSKAKMNLEKTLEDLNSTQQQVIQSEKLSSLGTVIAGIAHELNNPLMSVLNYVQYVRKHIDNGKLENYLKKAEYEICRSSAIIADLMEYSRTPDQHLTEINCKDVINRTIELLDIDFKSNNIKVIIGVPENIPKVMGKQDSLKQVFLNILINARHAMEDSITKEIHISGCLEGQNVRLAVCDTGHGIPDNIIRKVFDPFFTTKEPGKGTGLGLSVSRSIIKGFGGNLTCESQNGQGATFIIEIPAVRNDQLKNLEIET